MRLLCIKQPQTSASHSLSTTAGLIMKANLLSPFLSIFFLFLIFPTIINAKTKPTTYAKLLNPTTLGLKKEKLTHFRLYWHDIVAGPNATTTQLTKPVNTSTTGFGALVMIDDALTVGPDLNSKLVGRAQGMYALSAQNEVGLTMIMNFCFMEGKYNGSNISILGMNQVFNQVREMPIIGGSGLFRFARGYVQARTHTFNLTSGDACIEYNVYVLHY